MPLSNFKQISKNLVVNSVIGSLITVGSIFLVGKLLVGGAPESGAMGISITLFICILGSSIVSTKVVVKQFKHFSSWQLVPIWLGNVALMVVMLWLVEVFVFFVLLPDAGKVG